MAYQLSLLRRESSRLFSTYLAPKSVWSTGPSPPRLPKEDQEIFERLQRNSNGAFSRQREQSTVEEPTQIVGMPTFKDKEVVGQSIVSSIKEHPEQNSHKDSLDGRVQAVEGQELHPNIRRGSPPEFEGEVNPKTGESGGPKREPLRWGYTGDWSYNGRVTDF